MKIDLQFKDMQTHFDVRSGARSVRVTFASPVLVQTADGLRPTATLLVTADHEQAMTYQRVRDYSITVEPSSKVATQAQAPTKRDEEGHLVPPMPSDEEPAPVPPPSEPEPGVGVSLPVSASTEVQYSNNDLRTMLQVAAEAKEKAREEKKAGGVKITRKAA